MRKIYLGNNLFYAGIGLILLFLLSWKLDILFSLVKLGFWIFIACILVDLYLLFSKKQGIIADRAMNNRLSNGDDNDISIHLENRFGFPIQLEIIDEIPHQFQRRDIQWQKFIAPQSKDIFKYTLRPVKRGIYNFGAINIYALSPLGLIKRRFEFSKDKDVAVYPSFLQLKKYELAAFARKNFDLGVKKMRRIGHTMEFEQIKEYVQGDDTRFINWKASSRKNELMVNQFQDQKSQHIISVIDKGRLMKLPFQEMTLLDYAINATLVISNIAIKKLDKAGVISFSNKMSGFIPADKRRNQMFRIQEFLYAQKTNYKEANFELLHSFIRNSLNHRSLLLLYTNFETVDGMRRQLPYLQQLNKKHILVVIFFRNTEIQSFMQEKADNIRDVYTKVVAEKLHYEKSQIVNELRRSGIYSVLTNPQNLTIDTINKYLEIKAKGLI